MANIKKGSKKNNYKNAMYINFICTGNTCRSYIAEAIATHLLKTVYFKRKPGLKNNIIIASSGTDVMLSKIPVNTYRVLEKMEIPNIKFRPNKIDRSVVDNSDLLLTMATSHKKNIIFRFSNVDKKKIFNLIEISNIILYLESEDIYKRKSGIRNSKFKASRPYDYLKKLNYIEVSSIKSISKINDLYHDAKTNGQANKDPLEIAFSKLKSIKNIRTDSLIKPNSIDIEDPYGRSFNTYLKVAKLVKENIIFIFNYLFR